MLAETGPLEAIELANRALILPPSLTRIIKVLEEREFISRNKVEDDRRRALLAISPSGVALIEDLAPERTAIYNAIEKLWGRATRVPARRAGKPDPAGVDGKLILPAEAAQRSAASSCVRNRAARPRRCLDVDDTAEHHIVRADLVHRADLAIEADDDDSNAGMPEGMVCHRAAL